MKRKVLSLLLVCALAVSMSAIISGCGKSSSSSSSSANISEPIKIAISIDYPSKSKKADLENIEYKVEKKSHVLDATELFCNVNDISLLVDTTKNKVEGISGVNNGDYNSKYVWKYKVNGELCTDDPLEKAIKEGDTIEWIYAKK